jgi:ABC-type ATPase with predicted acetyltransferase domain
MSEDTKEIAFDELGLTKTLEKMTAKELRTLCMDKLPMVVGASGKSKEELVAEIKTIFGFVEEEAVSPYKKQIHETKRQIRALRAEKDATEDRTLRDRVRRKINKLKKRTRQLARAV